MIDETVFRNTWALLAERFNREPSQLMMRMYYKSLNARLSTEEFQRAASDLFETAEFFPKPADFFAATEPGEEADALEAWEGVHRLMRGFGDVEDLNPEARRVVALLGGSRKLRNTPLDAVQYVRRDFMELYGDAVAIAQREQGHRIEATPEARRITEAAMDGPQAVMELAEGKEETA